MSRHLPLLAAAALGLVLSASPALAEPDEVPGGRILSQSEAQSLQLTQREPVRKRDDGRYLQLVSESEAPPAPPLGRTPAVRPGAAPETAAVAVVSADR
jgi:hypothetical protein